MLADQAVITSLVEETDDLAGDVLATGLLVVHDSGGGGEDDVAELTRWQEPDDPLLQVVELDVVAGGDDTGLVEAVKAVSDMHTRDDEEEILPSVELNHDLAVAVVIDLLELANVACALHVSKCRD
jgi:hypothetical protein